MSVINASQSDPAKGIMNGVMWSAENDTWSTPEALFQSLNSLFNFEVDLAAQMHNAKCPKYYTPEQNSLMQEWRGVCWLNPPYGREIGQWIKKAYESSRAGATIVCLLPARTDTRWFHNYCVHGEITFLKGRLKFGQAQHNAPFPSMIVVFRPKVQDMLNRA